MLPAAVTVLDAAMELDDKSLTWTWLDWSCDYYKRDGQMMPDDGIEILIVRENTEGEYSESGALMLDHLGFTTSAARVMRAIETTLADPATRTGDLGRTANTSGVTDALVTALRSER